MVVVDVEVVDPGTYRALGIVQHGDDLLVGEAIHARPGAVEFADLAGVECGGLALVHKASAEVWTLPLCPGDAGDPYLTLVLGAVASLAGGLLEAPLRDARSHLVVVVLLRDALPLARIMWATHTLDLAALLATGLGAILQAGAHLQWDEWLTGVECCKVTATEPAVGLPRWAVTLRENAEGVGLDCGAGDWWDAVQADVGGVLRADGSRVGWLATVGRWAGASWGRDDVLLGVFAAIEALVVRVAVTLGG